MCCRLCERSAHFALLARPRRDLESYHGCTTTTTLPTAPVRQFLGDDAMGQLRRRSNVGVADVHHHQNIFNGEILKPLLPALERICPE